MDHLAVALLIPVALIVEHELRSVRRDLSETQERLDFAERLLAQSQERKHLGAPE
jgi:hypothetical protein